MLPYLLRRLLAGVATVWVVLTATFILIHIIPGGPFTSEKNLPAAVMANIERRYHLNEPLWKQYRDYLTALLKGDLGPSFRHPSRTVNELIGNGFPVSAALGGLALTMAVALGVPAGVLAAVRRGRSADHLVTVVTTLGISQPSFIVASVLAFVFAVRLGWLPVARWGTPLHAILPAISLGLFPAAFIARRVRAALLEALAQDYVRTARAKGLAPGLVVWRHALRNALLPAVTVLGPLAAQVLTGSLVVEQIFAIPGLGEHFTTSILNRDYTVIMGVTVFYAALAVAMNLLVDLIYTRLDPRIDLVARR